LLKRSARASRDRQADRRICPKSTRDSPVLGEISSRILSGCTKSRIGPYANARKGASHGHCGSAQRERRCRGVRPFVQTARSRQGQEGCDETPFQIRAGQAGTVAKSCGRRPRFRALPRAWEPAESAERVSSQPQDVVVQAPSPTRCGGRGCPQRPCVRVFLGPFLPDISFSPFLARLRSLSRTCTRSLSAAGLVLLFHRRSRNSRNPAISSRSPESAQS
jgi:hypothetical protein